MTDLPAVNAGDPHVAAHNDERTAINELSGRVLPDGWGTSDEAPGTLVMDTTEGPYKLEASVGPFGLVSILKVLDGSTNIEQALYATADGYSSILTYDTAEEYQRSQVNVSASSITINKTSGLSESQPTLTNNAMIDYAGIQVDRVDTDSGENFRSRLTFPATGTSGETIATRERVEAKEENSTNLSSVNSTVNTKDKYPGRMVLVHTNPGDPSDQLVPHWAAGSDPSSPWVQADGTPVNPV